MKLSIEEVAAQRSFIFLWCGSHEGLDEGRKVYFETLISFFLPFLNKKGCFL